MPRPLARDRGETVNHMNTVSRKSEKTRKAGRLTTSSLRPDLAELVSRAITRDRRVSEQARWAAYEGVKRELSLACGHDAPPDRRDQRQFWIATDVYVRGVRL